MPPADYTTAGAIRALLPDVSWGTTYDAALSTLITRASRLVDSYLGRAPGAFAASEDAVQTFRGDGTGELWIGELAAAPTLVEVKPPGGSYTAWDAADYDTYPYTAPAWGPIVRLDSLREGWPDTPRGVRITGRWGFSTTVPEEVAEAVTIQTVRWFKRGQQAYADVGAITELGQLRYVKALDPDVQVLLDLPRLQRVTL